MASKDTFVYLESFVDKFFDRMGEIGFGELSEVEKTFICVWSLGGEVDNGGFDQWLFNSSGDWALETPGSLRRIGAEKTASLVERAISVFPDGHPPEDLNARRDLMETIEEEANSIWSDLDKQFYKNEDDLDELLATYMKKNEDKTI